MFALSLYIPFMDNANRLFQKRFCFTQTGAGKAVMLTYLICVGVSAPIGIAVDKFGKRRYFIIGTMLVYFCAHFIFLIYPSCVEDTESGAIVGLVLIGIHSQ
jgi:MFS family permease